MKKTYFLNIPLALVLFLTACTSGGQAAASTATDQKIISQFKTDYTNSLPIASQLAVGTLNLDATSNAVDKTEAAQLLPLWQVLRVLSSSNNAAPEEINAAIHQIETTMTPAQVQAIVAMQLTQQDMGKVLAARGGGFNGNFTPEQQATRQAQRQSGGGGGFGGGGGPPPGGGFGGGGGGGFGGGQQVPSATLTAFAAQRSSGGGSTSGINPFLIGAVVRYLQSK